MDYKSVLDLLKENGNDKCADCGSASAYILEISPSQYPVISNQVFHYPMFVILATNKLTNEYGIPQLLVDENYWLKILGCR